MVYYRFDEAFVSIDPSFPLETFDLMVNFRFVGFTLIQYWSCYFLLKASKIPTTLYVHTGIWGFEDSKQNRCKPASLFKVTIEILYTQHSCENFQSISNTTQRVTLKIKRCTSLLLQ